MTRKDFEIIAEALYTVKPGEDGLDGDKPTWESTVRALARRFRLVNPRFDSARFFKACGMES